MSALQGLAIYLELGVLIMLVIHYGQQIVDELRKLNDK